MGVNKFSHKCYFITHVQNVHHRYITSRLRSKRMHSSTSVQPKPFQSIPGLSTLPIIGPLHNFLPVIGEIGPKGNLFELLGTLHKKYGSVVKMAGVFARADSVILFEPEDFEQVYKAEEATPLRPAFDTMVYHLEHYNKTTSSEGITGLITAQGPKWREIRTKVNPALLKPKLIKLYSPALEDIAKDMVKRLMELKNDSDYLQWNFDLEMTKWSLESVAVVGLGARLGCLRNDISDDHPARQLIRNTKDIFNLSFKLEFIPNPWRYIATPSFKKLMKTYDNQWETSAMYINEARKKINDRGHDIPEEDKSIIEKLLGIDEKVAVMMANEMLLAGIDTVAFATTSLLYFLARNPRVQDKLREDIRKDDSNRQYLRACLKESLRFWHVVPANLRRSSKEHVVAGYLIPKGIDIIAPNEYLSRLEKYYPQPNEFLPERWLVEKSDPLYFGNAHPMVTLPFGYGVRSCIGRRIGELEIETFVKTLIKDVKVSWDGPDIKMASKLVNSFAKPYYFKFEVIK